MDLIRSFIAIEIPQDVKDTIVEIQKNLRKIGANIRWVKTDGIHLTLKFLGDIKETDISKIEARLKNVCNGFLPFILKVKDMGVFPDIKRPRIIWIGIEDASGTLQQLQGKIDFVIKDFCSKKEKRERFTPHLTIGRIKLPYRDAGLLSEAMDEFEKSEVGTFEAKEVSLIKSDLKPEGAMYTTLARISIGHHGS
ncbi:MAG: RNA 2',3'-cyclic phosphodiesterase [Nitrospirota bacterium]